MVDTFDRNRMASLLTEAITTLCRKGLQFHSEFTVEGLLGITLDNKDIILVNIKEIVTHCDVAYNGETVPGGEVTVVDNSQIIRKPEDIFPKRRKKRKSSTVNKRKISYPGLESPYIDNFMVFDTAKSAPSAIGFRDTDINTLVCEDLSSTGTVKDSTTKSFIDIPITNLSNTADYNIALSYNDGTKDNNSDVSSHSNCLLPKDDSDQFTSLQQSPRISFTDSFALDLGLGHNESSNNLTADWTSEAMDMPLNLSDVKPLQSKYEKKHTCSSCGRNYKSEYSLKKHKCKNGILSEVGSVGGHEGSVQPLDLTVRDPMDASPLAGIDLDIDTDLTLDDGLLTEQYNCICSRAFNEYAPYAEHIASCHKAKLTPYKACEICGKYFFSNSGYVKHKRLHVGAYKFRCDICRKGFFDRTHLRAHMDSSHSKVRRYECKHCCKSFFWKHHLKRHLGTCDKAKVVPGCDPVNTDTPSPGEDVEMGFQLSSHVVDM